MVKRKEKISTIDEATKKVGVSRKDLLELLAEGQLTTLAYHKESQDWVKLSPDSVKEAIYSGSNKVLFDFTEWDDAEEEPEGTDNDDDFENDNDDSRCFVEVDGNGDDLYIGFDLIFLWNDELAKLNVKSFKPNNNFTSVTHDGKSYTFTGTQADVIKFLYEQHQKGTPEVHQDQILKHIGDKGDNRIDKVFRQRGKAHPAFGKLVLKVRTATYKLNID